MHRPALALLLLFTVGAAAGDRRDWRPLDAAAAKAAPPPHLVSLSALPAGSVSRWQAAPAKAAGDWWLQLPDGSRHRVLAAGQWTHPNGDTSYSGSIEGGGSLSPVLLTVGREASFGSWTTPQGRFRFESWGDEGWLVDLGHPGIRLLAEDEHAIAPEHTVPARSDAGGKNVASTLDVLFLYSQGFSTRYPGSATATRINHLIAVANQVFANSGLSLAVRSVGMDASAYPDSEGSNQTALSRMREALRGNSAGSHAAFGNLRQRRSSSGADLVVLLRPADIETRGSCGIAYLFARDANSAVNVTNDGFSSWSLCGDEVLVHEIGHNLGAEHQVGASSQNAGFGTAFVLPGRLNTVMGSFGSGHPDRRRRVDRFSNPLQRCAGRPCGIPNVADNVRRIGDNMAAVAGYTNSPTGLPAAQAPAAQDLDSDGDGRPDSADAFPFDARWQDDRDGDGVADGEDAFPDDAQESRDSDGDGVGDNADADDDNDGTPDNFDVFDSDRNEQRDSDDDGVGDNGDAFPNERSEWRDSDGDGVGDNADPDRDGDGVADLGDGEELWVVSAGSDRVLRYRGEDGLFEGVVLAETHIPQVFGPQARLAWNARQKQVYALAASELRRYRPASGARIDTFIAGWRDGPRPGFLSGFPQALSLAADGTVLAADGSTLVLQRHDASTGAIRTGGQFGVPNFFVQYPRASTIDAAGTLWTIERDGRLSAVEVASGNVLSRFTPVLAGSPALTEATALLTDADGARLLAADAQRNSVFRIDPATGIATVFIAAGAGGLSAPAGIERLADGSLVVSSSGSDRLLRFDADGQPLGRFDRGPAGVLQQPRALLRVPRSADRFPDDPARALLPVAGGWANPARLGHGLDLQNVGGQLAVIWYTFRADGTPTWYLASAPLQGRRWDAPLLQFRWENGRATSREVGSARLDFADERNAMFSWDLPAGSGSEPMQPLAVGPSNRTQFPTAAWFAADEPGWGLSITRQGGVDYAIAFLYDTVGEPAWLAGAVDDASRPTRFAMQHYSGPTRCPGCPGAADPATVAAGELQFSATALDTTRAQLALRHGTIDWQRSERPLQRLTDTPTAASGDPLPTP